MLLKWILKNGEVINFVVYINIYKYMVYIYKHIYVFIHLYITTIKNFKAMH